MSDTPRHSVACVGIVIDDAGNVLVIKRRDTGAWEPPGGVLELDESLEAGAAREVLEETGVRVHVEGLTGVYKNMPHGIITLSFRCRPVDCAPHPTAETAEVVWLSPHDARARMAEAHAVRIADALEPSGLVMCRLHDGHSIVN